MDRRTLLRLVGTTATGGLAGCAGGDTAGTPEPTPTMATESTATDTPMTTETDTDTPTATATESPQRDTEAGLVTVRGDESVGGTVSRIETAIERSPLALMATVDHAANAASADMDLPPTTVLIFGNPNVGTPLMQESRSVAIDLPQKMLVWEDDGTVKVTYNDPQYLARRHGIDGQDERLETVADALRTLATGESG